jgi:hypothetical protein
VVEEDEDISPPPVSNPAVSEGLVEEDEDEEEYCPPEPISIYTPYE